MKQRYERQEHLGEGCSSSLLDAMNLVIYDHFTRAVTRVTKYEPR